MVFFEGFLTDRWRWMQCRVAWVNRQRRAWGRDTRASSDNIPLAPQVTWALAFTAAVTAVVFPPVAFREKKS